MDGLICAQTEDHVCIPEGMNVSSFPSHFMLSTLILIDILLETCFSYGFWNLMVRETLGLVNVEKVIKG